MRYIKDIDMSVALFLAFTASVVGTVLVAPAFAQTNDLPIEFLTLSSNNVPIGGANVTLYNLTGRKTLVGSCLTNSTGKCTITITFPPATQNFNATAVRLPKKGYREITITPQGNISDTRTGQLLQQPINITMY